tara:strand:- start:2440 stop:2736 length:297 start_codon:yes stop_codon:yes gene_type:complete
MKTIIENEQPFISCYCMYNWHYKTYDELLQAFEDDEFGLQTLVSFYPSGIWLTNNFDDFTQLEEKGIQWTKQITYKEFEDMLTNGSIANNGLYDWEKE